MTGLLGAVLTAVLAAVSIKLWLLPALLPAVLPLVLLAVSGAAAACAGRRAVRALAPRLDAAEATVAGATLGLGLLSLGEFALAASGLLRPWAAAGLLAVLWLVGWAELEPAARSLRDGAKRALARPWLCALIGLPLLAALWACLVPPHQYDALVYHLALPQDYLRAGRLYAPPGILYAHFPQNGEMLFTLALSLGSDLLAQMYMWTAAALSILWLLTFGRRLTPAAPWAAALTATLTAVLLLASTAYVEPLVMLWTTAALLSFEASGEGGDGGLLLLSALFTGLALGTKYYAGLLAVVLALRLLWRDRVKAAALFTAVVTALFAPWLVKNWLFVGNPVFPFLYKLFPATSIGWTSSAAAGYFKIMTQYGHKGGFLHDLLRLPVLLVRDPLRYGGGMDVLGDLGWNLVLWLWPIGLWAAWKKRAPRGLALLTALYVAGWFSTGVVLRFLTALAPALALVGAAGAAAWWAKAGRPARVVAAAAAGVLTASHLFLFLYVHGVFGSQEVLLAQLTRGQFLSRRLDYYPCAAFARSLPADADLLVVGEQRGYYIPRAHRSTTVDAPNLYVTAADAASSPADLARTLRGDGFTHLLFVPRESARLGDSVGTFTAKGAANWRGLEPHLKTVYRGPACLVAALGGS